MQKAVIGLVGALVLVPACGNSSDAKTTGSSSASAAKKDDKKEAILKKPIAELTEQDMIAAATALGWGDKPSSSHSKGLNETIIVSGDKEDPEGTDSPDGKKRLRFSIGLYMETPETLERSKASLAEEGAAFEVSGNRILNAKYQSAKGANHDEAKKILDRLLGR